MAKGEEKKEFGRSRVPRLFLADAHEVFFGHAA